MGFGDGERSELSSQITAKVPAVKAVTEQEILILKAPLLRNSLLRAFKTSSCRVLHPHTVTSEEVGIACADNLFDYVVRSFWTSRFLLGVSERATLDNSASIQSRTARFPKQIQRR